MCLNHNLSLTPCREFGRVRFPPTHMPQTNRFRHTHRAGDKSPTTSPRLRSAIREHNHGRSNSRPEHKRYERIPNIRHPRRPRVGQHITKTKTKPHCRRKRRKSRQTRITNNRELRRTRNQFSLLQNPGRVIICTIFQHSRRNCDHTLVETILYKRGRRAD